MSFRPTLHACSLAVIVKILGLYGGQFEYKIITNYFLVLLAVFLIHHVLTRSLGSRFQSDKHMNSYLGFSG